MAETDHGARRDRPPERPGGRLAVIAALTSNAVVAAAKVVGFVFTGSASLLAETFHSVADTGNQGLLLVGESQAQKTADREHPFGRARERYFWAFVVATMLFTLGSLVSLAEGIEKLRSPHDVGSYPWAFAILGIAVVAETASLRTATRNARPIKGSRTWWRFIRTTKHPEFPVVLLEDSGALAGLALALGGPGRVGGDRRSPLRRPGQRRHRRAPRGGGHRAGRRDAQPAHR